MSEQVQQVSVLAGLGAAKSKNAQDILAGSRADYERILAVLYENGFFGASVSILMDGREATAIPLIAPPARIDTVIVRIDAGLPFRFGVADTRPRPEPFTLPEAFRRGEIARLSAIRDAVGATIDAWRDVGHAKAAPAAQEITADHPRRVLDARVTIDPGPRLRFGELIIEDGVSVREARIREIAGFPRGLVFSPAEIEKIATRFRRTGTFSSIALSEAEKPGPDGTLDVTVQLVENPPRRIGFGGEISSLDGLTLNGFWLHRNLLGGAERLRIEGEARGIEGESGGEDYTFSAQFDRPATFNQDTDLYIRGEAEKLNEVNFSSEKFSVGAGIRRYASDTRTYTFGLGVESAKTSDVFGDRSYTLLMGYAGATFDYRDDTLDAKDGYYLDASVTPFFALAGEGDGVLTELDARFYRSFGKQNGMTFALRGQLGSVAGAPIDEVPADYLFYSGGGGTVRGQPYQSLAVDLGGGSFVGGRSFLALSSEIRMRATERIGLVAFYDAGYVGPEAFPDGSSGDWHSGAGIGVRYGTGIGPIRMDLAVPVSGPGDQSGFQVYIGIGQAF
ncbi:MAG: BamA/TamA family outer membrane protein [Litoreibacter sp.]|nr:BamA/TamA family outer membrane protein [Litoreibacter sp.]